MVLAKQLITILGDIIEITRQGKVSHFLRSYGDVFGDANATLKIAASGPLER
jgi:hypothetical protein